MSLDKTELNLRKTILGPTISSGGNLSSLGTPPSRRYLARIQTSARLHTCQVPVIFVVRTSSGLVLLSNLRVACISSMLTASKSIEIQLKIRISARSAINLTKLRWSQEQKLLSRGAQILHSKAWLRDTFHRSKGTFLKANPTLYRKIP